MEFALSSHAAVLEEASLLAKDSRIRGHHPFPPGPLYEGLVIDDYFAVSLQHVADPCPPRSLECFEKAIAKYKEENVLVDHPRRISTTAIISRLLVQRSTAVRRQGAEGL